jgi:hypothetical protein
MANPLNLHWISTELALGGSYPMERAGELATQLGIRRVVDVRSECCDDAEVLRAHGIELLHLPTQDMMAVSQAMLEKGVAWVNAQLAAGQRVYIHCEHGIGRSALLMLCVLVSRGSEPLAALDHAKSRRALVSPSPEQLEAFREFLRYRATHAVPWNVPTFEELAWIAYSHLRQKVS